MELATAKEIHGSQFLRDVEVLELGGVSAGESELQCLGTLRTVKRLCSERARLADREVQAFVPMQQAVSLGLADTQITDVGLESAAELVNLRVLDISHANITDRGGESLKKPRHLVSLDITGTHMTTTGLRSLSEMENLEEIQLSREPFDYDQLRALVDKTVLISLVDPKGNVEIVNDHYRRTFSGYRSWSIDSMAKRS